MKKLITATVIWMCLCISSFAQTSENKSVITPVLSRSQLKMTCVGFATSNAVPEARSIRDLLPFENKLYIGHGNFDKNTGPTDVIYWDLDKACFTKEFIVDDESIENYDVLDGNLVITGSDATEDWSLGNVYVRGKNGWTKYRTVPNAVHVFSAASFEGRWYISTHAVMAFPYGTKGKPGVGMILSSSDKCKTWRFEYASACEINTDVWNTAIIRYNDRLYAFCQAFTFPNTPKFKEENGPQSTVRLNYTGLNDAVVYDGNNWSETSLIKKPNVCAITPFLVGDYLGLSTAFCRPGSPWPPAIERVALYRFDGMKTQLCQLSVQVLQDVESFENGAVLLVKLEGKWAVAETTDLQNIQIFFLPEDIKEPTSITKARNIIYIGTSEGLLYKAERSPKPIFLSPSERASSR